jgi:hypothetical protein
VLRQVLREALVMTAPGVLAGVVIALAAAGVLGDKLVKVRVTDPLTFAAAAVFLGLVALIASYFLACRATDATPGPRWGAISRGFRRGDGVPSVGRVSEEEHLAQAQ